MKDIYKQDQVIQQIMKRHPHEIVTSTLTNKNFSAIMREHVAIWMRHQFKTRTPVRAVGLLVELLEDKALDEWTTEDFEVFLGSKMGIMGSDGKEKQSPKV